MMPAANQGVGQNVGYPDVCNTPTGTGVDAPIPYPNLGQDTLSAVFSPTVYVSFLPAHSMAAAPSMTNGDNAGVTQPTGNMGSGGCTMGNPIVFVSGQPAEHMCTTSQGNRYNNSLGAKLIPALTNVFISFAGVAPGGELAWDATRALLDELDDHPDPAAPGLTWQSEGARARVLHVRRGGLGWRLGLRRDDRVVAWHAAAPARPHPARLATGPRPVRPGERVTVQVQRGARMLTRTALQPRPAPAVLTARRGEQARIAIRRFTHDSAAQVREAVARLTHAGATQLELDLRGCPGGSLPAAAAVAALFLPPGAPIATLQAGADRVTLTAAHERPLALPLQVRVDAHTASAAEVLATALTRHARATRRGPPTWGKRHAEWLHGPSGAPHRRTIWNLLT